ncbi:MAG: metallophosphoesterase family protein [Hyphomicrobiales bacterium]|nr:metallophosphoesterase family protein [Hyphomicrobiales bacterium]
MLIALLSDIHANREAFDACMAQARRAGAERFVFLGDLVGYGADPSYVVDQVARCENASVILGNHDEAVFGSAGGMNAVARAAIEWTRSRLDRAQIDFLRALPRTAREGDLLFVHSDASRPEDWRYVADAESAERSLRASDAHVTFCGHTHRPQLYHRAPQRSAMFFAPDGQMPTPLSRGRQWLAVAGSVGQPRDRNPAAAFCLYDMSRRELSFRRAPYDVAAAAGKIVAARLPDILSERLFLGR